MQPSSFMMLDPSGQPMALPPGFNPGKAGAAARTPLPAGAARMQGWYVDSRGRHVKTDRAVPVDKNDHRTKHRLGTCPKADCKEINWVLPNEARFCPVHRSKLTLRADAGGAGAARRRELAATTMSLHGASAFPWLILLLLLAAGAAVHLGQVDGLQLAAAAPAVGALVWAIARQVLWARAVKRGVVEQGQKAGRKVRRVRGNAVRVAVHALLAVAWLALVAESPSPVSADVWSPGRAVWVLLLVGWAVRTYPWWAQVDARRSRGEPLALPAAPPAGDQRDPLEVKAAATWDALIGKDGGPLPGTYLLNWTRLPACSAGGPDRKRLPNWQATVRARVDGAVNMREARPLLLGRIAAAFGVSYGDVTFTADDSDLSTAYLRVQPDNPLAEVRMFAGGDVDDWVRGWSAVGWHDDGSPARYAWWTETGAVHELISGCTGSGKSELVVQLMLRSLNSGGLVIDWLGDPQNGQSYGAVKHKVAYFAPSLAEIRLMLLAALKEMNRRTEWLSNHDMKTWRATLDMPELVLTLDEVQGYIDDPAILEMVERLVGQGRKAGIKLRLVTQVPAVYSLGGSGYIKEQLRAGQSFVFRAATDTAGRLAVDGDSPIDPTMLPVRWGKWTCGSEKTTAGLCFIQGIYGSDRYGRAFYTGEGEDMLRWLATTTPGVFSEEAQQVAGVLWSGRAQRAALALAQGRSDEELLRGGKAVELIREAQILAEVGYDPTKLPDSAENVAAGKVSRDVVHAAAWQAAEGSTTQEVEKKDIVELTAAMPTGTRDKAIGDLISDGALERGSARGTYRVVKPPR